MPTNGETMGKLTAAEVKNLTLKADGRPIKKSDGYGLYILVNKAGKYWRYSYRFLGKQKTLSLGVYANLILWVFAKRSKYVAWPEPMDSGILAGYQYELSEIINAHQNMVTVSPDQEVRKVWEEKYYRELTQDKPGMVGCVTKASKVALEGPVVSVVHMDPEGNIFWEDGVNYNYGLLVVPERSFTMEEWEARFSPES